MVAKVLLEQIKGKTVKKKYIIKTDSDQPCYLCYKDNITQDWAGTIKAMGIIPRAWTID